MGVVIGLRHAIYCLRWQIRMFCLFFSLTVSNTIVSKDKKVLLRERKRHTARRGAIASPCYSGWGVPWQKKFVPVWTCIKPNLVSKIFPFTGGGPSTKIFFPSLNIYQAKSGVKNFSLYWDWVPPLQIWDLGPPTWTWDPPIWTWTWDPPWTDKHLWKQPPVVRTYAGGKYVTYVCFIE